MIRAVVERWGGESLADRIEYCQQSFNPRPPCGERPDCDVGKLVETAETEVLFHHPLHPYTEALLASVPKPNPRVKKIKIELTGEVPSPANPPAGCYFHPRCAYTQPVCSQEEPQLRELEPGHFVACHRANEINLRGVLG